MSSKTTEDWTELTVLFHVSLKSGDQNGQNKKGFGKYRNYNHCGTKKILLYIQCNDKAQGATKDCPFMSGKVPYLPGYVTREGKG